MTHCCSRPSLGFWGCVWWLLGWGGGVSFFFFFFFWGFWGVAVGCWPSGRGFTRVPILWFFFVAPASLFFLPFSVPSRTFFFGFVFHNCPPSCPSLTEPLGALRRVPYEGTRVFLSFDSGLALHVASRVQSTFSIDRVIPIDGQSLKFSRRSRRIWSSSLFVGCSCGSRPTCN